MLISLPNGKTISMKVEDYLDMTDAQIKDLMADNYGEYLEDPFAMSFSISDIKEVVNIDEVIEELEEDFPDIEEDYDSLDYEKED